MAVKKRLWIRWVVAISILIPLLMFLAFVGAMTFKDFNQYKPQIQNIVEQKTGHTLQIKGDVNVQIIPFSLTLQDMILKNHSDFDDLNFLTLEKARIQISLWDLFINQNVKVTSLDFNSPKLYLNVLPSGKTNWQSFEKLITNITNVAFNQITSKNYAFNKVSYQQVNIKTSSETGLVANKSSWHLESLSVSNAEVIFQDKQAERHILLQNIDLLALDLQPEKAFNLALKLDYENINNPLNLAFDLSTYLTVNKSISTWLFSDWQGFMMLATPELQNSPLTRIAVVGEGLSLDFSKQIIAIKQAKFDLLETQVLLSSQGTFGKNISIEGELNAQNFNLLNWQKHLEATNFKFVDESALNEVGVSLQFILEDSDYSFNDIVVKVDDSTLTGHFWKTGGENAEYSFNLEIDQLNLDRYAIKTKIAIEDNEDKSNQDKITTKLYHLTEPYLPIALPINTLRELNASGQIKVSQLQAWQLKFTDLETTITANKGEIEFAPLDASFYQGSLQSRLQLNVTKDTPEYAWRGRVTDVQLTPFLTAGWQNKQLSGTYSGFFNLNTKGVNSYLLRQNMNGSFSAKIAEGSVIGMDLNRLLAGKKSSPDDKTQFKLLDIDGTLTNGVYHIAKMNVISERFSAIGAGTVNLAPATINVRVNTLIKQPPPGLENLAGLQVPINIKGTTGNINWVVDAERLLNDFRRALHKWGAK